MAKYDAALKHVFPLRREEKRPNEFSAKELAVLFETVISKFNLDWISFQPFRLIEPGIRRGSDGPDGDDWLLCCDDVTISTPFLSTVYVQVNRPSFTKQTYILMDKERRFWLLNARWTLDRRTDKWQFHSASTEAASLTRIIARYRHTEAALVGRKVSFLLGFFESLEGAVLKATEKVSRIQSDLKRSADELGQISAFITLWH